MPTRRGFLLASAAALTLKNRRSEAVPIAPAERDSRLERARKIMGDLKLNAIVLAGGTSLDYFTSLRWGNSERLFAFVLPQSGKPFYIAPAFEEDRVRERMKQDARIYTWRKTITRTHAWRRDCATPAFPPAASASKKKCPSYSPTASPKPHPQWRS